VAVPWRAAELTHFPTGPVSPLDARSQGGGGCKSRLLGSQQQDEEYESTS